MRLKVCLAKYLIANLALFREADWINKYGGSLENVDFGIFPKIKSHETS